MSLLDDLFDLLRQAASPPEIAALQQRLEEVWLQPGHPMLDKYLEAGLRALAAEHYTAAIESFSLLLTAAPWYAEGWYQRARAHEGRGEWQAALRDFAHSLRLEPRHLGALVGRAQLWSQLQHWANARRDLERVAALCPNWPGVREQLYDLRYKSSNSGN